MNQKRKGCGKQARVRGSHDVLVQVRELLTRMVAGIASTKAELTSWVHAQGLAATMRSDGIA